MTLTATSPAAQAVSEVQVDYNKVLEHLKLNPKDPKTQALVLVSQRYGLDPVLKHVLIVDGDVYVTHKGLLHVAHRSGVYDGTEVLDQGETDTHWTAKVAVYRSDMNRSFTFPGRYPKLRGKYEWSDGPNGKRVKTKVAEEPHPYGPEMAIKTAECAALRRAFDVALGVVEERWDLEEPAATTVQTSAVSAPSAGSASSPEAADESAPAAAGDPTAAAATNADRLRGHCTALGVEVTDARSYLFSLRNEPGGDRYKAVRVTAWEPVVDAWDAATLDDALAAVTAKFGGAS